jgi:hypothetical protein
LVRIIFPRKHPGSVKLTHYYPEPPRDRASDLLAIAVENYKNGNIATAEAAWNERCRLLDGERTNWIDDGPRQPFRPMRIVRPWEMGK